MPWNYYSVYIFVLLDDSSLWGSVFSLISRERKWCSFSNWFLPDFLIMTFEIQGNVCCTSVVQSGWRHIARLTAFGFALELILFHERVDWRLSWCSAASQQLWLPSAEVQWARGEFVDRLCVMAVRGHPVNTLHLESQLTTTEDKFPGGKHYVNYEILGSSVSW